MLSLRDPLAPVPLRPVVERHHEECNNIMLGIDQYPKSMKIPDCHQHVCECAGRPTLYVCASACVCKCVKLATDEFSMCANVCSFVRVCVCVCTYVWLQTSDK